MTTPTLEQIGERLRDYGGDYATDLSRTSILDRCDELLALLRAAHAELARGREAERHLRNVLTKADPEDEEMMQCDAMEWLAAHQEPAR